MGIEIKSGAEDVVQMSESLTDKPDTLFIAYDPDTQTVSGSYDKEAVTGSIVAFVRKPIDASALKKIVEAGYRAITMEREPACDCSANEQYTSDTVKSLIKDSGFKAKHYGDLIMGAFAWRLHRDAKLYVSLSGNCYCDAAAKADLWFYDTCFRDGDVYIGNTLPSEYAERSLYEVVTALIAVFCAKRDALLVMKDYARG